MRCYYLQHGLEGDGESLSTQTAHSIYAVRVIENSTNLMMGCEVTAHVYYGT